MAKVQNRFTSKDNRSFLSRLRLTIHSKRIIPSSMFFYSLVFLLGRLWFFIDYPIPIVHPDSASYYSAFEEISQDATPEFNYRTPGYPLFLFLVFNISDSLISLVLAQTVFSYLSGAFLLYTILKFNRVVGLISGIFLASFYVDWQSQEHDTAMLTESIYTSLNVLFFTLLFRFFLIRSQPSTLMLASIVGGLVVLVRPGGYFIVAVLTCVAFFVYSTRKNIYLVLRVFLPFASILISQAAYNYATIGTVSPGNQDVVEINLVTNPFWETNPLYPSSINSAIRRVNVETINRYGSRDLATLKNSWSFSQLYPIYLKSHYYDPHTEIAEVTDGWGGESWRSWMEKLALDTLKAHPEQFIKRYLVMMVYYYGSSLSVGDQLDNMANRVKTIYLERAFSPERNNALLTSMAKEFADATRLPEGIQILEPSSQSGNLVHETIDFEETANVKIYSIINEFLNQQWIWALLSIMSLLIFFISPFLIFRTRGTDRDLCFFIFLLTLGIFVQASIVSLVEYSQPRYSYPMEWSYGIALSLALKLLISMIAKVENVERIK